MVSRWPATTVVLMVLLAASAASLWLGGKVVIEADGDHAAASIGVLVLAFAKIWLIVRYFMEVRFGPQWLRVALDLWIATVFVTVTALFLMTP